MILAFFFKKSLFDKKCPLEPDFFPFFQELEGLFRRSTDKKEVRPMFIKVADHRFNDIPIPAERKDVQAVSLSPWKRLFEGLAQAGLPRLPDI